MYRFMVKKMVKINLAITLLCELCNFRLSGVPNKPCDSTEMLNVHKGVTLVDNKLQTLQLQSVLQIIDASLSPAFLNARFAFHCQNVRLVFTLWPNQNARSAFLWQKCETGVEEQGLFKCDREDRILKLFSKLLC